MAKIDPSKSPREGCGSCVAASLCREFGWKHPGFIANCAGTSTLPEWKQLAYREIWTAQRDGQPIPSKYGGSAAVCKVKIKPTTEENP